MGSIKKWISYNIRKNKLNKYKERVKKQCKVCGDILNVNGPSVVNNCTELGNNINFNGIKVIGEGRVVIGDNFHSGEGCYIITQNHDYDNGDSIPYDSSRSIVKDVIIEDNVWIGIGVIILPGSYIEEGAIIQAGSVVMGRIKACGIYGGHPAVFIKNRNVEHYNELKKNGSFF